MRFSSPFRVHWLLVAGNWVHLQESPLVKGSHLAQSYSSSHNPQARTGLCEATNALPLALLGQTLMCQSRSRAPTGSDDVMLPLHLTCLSLSLFLPNTTFISASQLTFQRTDPTKTPAHKSPSQSISWEPDLRSPLRHRSPQKLCQKSLKPSLSLFPSFLSLPTNIVTLKQMAFLSVSWFLFWMAPAYT